MDLNTLWIGGSLPPLQGLCLKSAVATGCRVRLFVYEKTAGIPEGVEVADARGVLGLDKMIRHRKSQSVALFSDRFRYAILSLGLGAWFDTDMLFLKAPQATGDCLVGWENGHLVSAGFIWMKPGHPLIDDLVRHAADEHPVPAWYPAKQRLYLMLRKLVGRPRHVSDLEWGVIGPDLLTWLLRERDMIGEARPVAWSCPIPYEERHQISNGAFAWRDLITDETVCIHLWNHDLSRDERFRKPEPGSLLHEAAAKCGYTWQEI